MSKTIAYLKPIFLSLAFVVLVACEPPADFRYLSGESGRLSDYKGDWVIINFWAEWCSPCRAEVEVLSKMVKHQQPIPFKVIGISYDPLDMSALETIVNDWGFEYPVLATNPVPILPFSLPNKLPALYILDPSLNLVAQVSGEQTEERINKLLKSLEKKQK